MRAERRVLQGGNASTLTNSDIPQPDGLAQVVADMYGTFFSKEERGAVGGVRRAAARVQYCTGSMFTTLYTVQLYY